MSKVFLKIENLTKNFGQFTALRDISLEVFQGEFVCFLGPSGCGKTTLLRAIAGLDIQTKEYCPSGCRYLGASAGRARLWDCFPILRAFPNLSVEKNVAYGLESRRAQR